MKLTHGLALAATLFGGFASAQTAPTPPTAEERAALFAEADGDGSGGLTRAELDALFELVREDRGDRLFASADADGSGEVTQSELEAARSSRGRRGGRGGRPKM